MASGYANRMNKAIIVPLLLIALLVAFVLDPRNQTAFKLMVSNLATEQAVMKGVGFRAPFVPDKPPAKTVPSRYPTAFIWEDDATLKYAELEDGYLQTFGLRLQDGQVMKKEEDEELGSFRFKFNPPSDPLHPGHSLVAVNSPYLRLSFAPLGPIEFENVRNLPETKWLQREENEQAAVWNCKPGDVIGIKLERIKSYPVPISSESATIKALYAKVLIKKLSHEAVRIDYVFGIDGKNDFPPPNHAAD